MLLASLSLSGRVQGVFCRKFIQELAQRLSISGKARNEKDGTVRIDCECRDESHFEGFIREIKSGGRGEIYSGIRIDKIEILEKRHTGNPRFTSFEIA